jgi:methylmalonyl-CoA mutase N-terminal domain/subunit
VEAAVRTGLDVNAFGKRLSFFFAVHNNVIEEIAKFRAARRLWARLMRDRFGASDPRAQQLRFHSQTAGSTLTAQQPNNNIVRVALQALAAVLGGTQSLHCNGRDEALGLPTEESARIALRTQQILATETGVANNVDPVAGSYAIELRTNELERDIQALLGKIDELGGMVVAIENGEIQRTLQNTAFHTQQQIDAGEQIVVGVNKFSTKTRPDIDSLQIDTGAESVQRSRLQRLRTDRDSARSSAALVNVTAAAHKDSNLMPPIIAAVEARCTVGEISDALRVVFGEYQDLA